MNHTNLSPAGNASPTLPIRAASRPAFTSTTGRAHSLGAVPPVRRLGPRRGGNEGSTLFLEISGAARASRQGTNRYYAPDPERCGLQQTGGLAGSTPAAADRSLRRDVSIGAGAGGRFALRLAAARSIYAISMGMGK